MANEKGQGMNSTLKGMLWLLVIGGGLAFAGVKLDFGKFGKVDPGRGPPEGEPIKVKFVTRMLPQQSAEVIKINFTYANVGIAFRNTVAATVTMQVSKEAPEAEQVVTFPCAAHYNYAIESKSVVVYPQGVVQAKGSGDGAVTLRGDEQLHYSIDTHDPVRLENHGQGSVLTMSYRASLKTGHAEAGGLAPKK